MFPLPENLENFSDKIRISNFETSIKNEEEDLYSLMRYTFDKLMIAFMEPGSQLLK